MNQVKTRARSIGPIKQHVAFVRFTPKMLYISATAMKIMRDTEYVKAYIDKENNCMLIKPSKENEINSMKLCRVCESENARRIETTNALLSIIESGFPHDSLNKVLNARESMDGGLIVDFACERKMQSEQQHSAETLELFIENTADAHNLLGILMDNGYTVSIRRGFNEESGLTEYFLSIKK